VPFIVIFISLIFLGCTTSRPSLPAEKPRQFVNLSEVKKDLVTCGIEGNLLQRIRSCQETNPSMSRYTTSSKNVVWQQVHYDSRRDFHIWLDGQQGFLWTSPIAESQKGYCEEAFQFSNGNKPFEITIPSVKEYRTLFSYNIPPMLYKSKARFFRHLKTDEIGMVTDEKNQKFLNYPDQNEVWIRCIAK